MPQMLRVNVFAGPSDNPQDKRPATTAQHIVSERDLSDALRQIGLEWKNADYMPNREVIITISSLAEVRDPEIGEKIREAAAALEATGLI